MVTRKGPLHAVLAHLSRSLERSSTPILQHVQLISDGTTLRIAATDLKVHLVATVPCDGPRFVGCLPMKALSEFVKPDDVADKRSIVELLPEDDRHTTIAVEAALVTLASRCAKEMPTRPGDNLERSSWVRLGSWDAGEFIETLRWVMLAAGSDPSRSNLTGIFLDGEQVVATDGHRLHASKFVISGEPVLVSARALGAFLRALPKNGVVTMERSGDILRIQAGAWELETVVMKEQFPPYKQVVPKIGAETFAVEVERKTLTYALARVAKTKGGSKSVRMVCNGAIKLERDHGDGTSMSTVQIVTTTHRGADSIIGADPGFLLDVLDTGEEIVTVRFGGALDPIRFDLGRGRQGVVMPMRT